MQKIRFSVPSKHRNSQVPLLLGCPEAKPYGTASQHLWLQKIREKSTKFHHSHRFLGAFRTFFSRQSSQRPISATSILGVRHRALKGWQLKGDPVDPFNPGLFNRDPCFMVYEIVPTLIG